MMNHRIAGIVTRMIHHFHGLSPVRNHLLKRRKWSPILMNFWWRGDGVDAALITISQIFKNHAASCSRIGWKLRNTSQKKIRRRHWKRWSLSLTKKLKRWGMKKNLRVNSKSKNKNKRIKKNRQKILLSILSLRPQKNN